MCSATSARTPPARCAPIPNAIAREAVRGQEYDAFSAGNSPEHTLTIPFTRMLSGPMDYTPGIMNILWDPQNLGRRVHTTVAKQLSYYVNYFSGVQMAADLPEHYAGAPGLAFIEDVPAAVGREPRAVRGGRRPPRHRAPRRTRVVRRRDDRGPRADPATTGSRSSAAATGSRSRTPTRRRPTTTTNPTALAINRSIVTRRDTFVAALERSGGQAVRFRPATAADRASLPRYRRARTCASRRSTRRRPSRAATS